MNIDGTLLVNPVNKDGELESDRVKVAPYAKPFMQWAVRNFNVRWLTDRSPHEAFTLARVLDIPPDAVPYASWGMNKTDAIHPKENFFWIDNEVMPNEHAWVQEHRNGHRLLGSDPNTGISKTHIAILKSQLRNPQQPRSIKAAPSLHSAGPEKPGFIDYVMGKINPV